MSRFPRYLRQQLAAQDQANVDRATHTTKQVTKPAAPPENPSNVTEKKPLWVERLLAFFKRGARS